VAFELKDGQFTLFVNKKKQNEKSPAMVGKANIGGKVYDLSAWSKTSDKAGKWLSGAIKDEWKPGREKQHKISEHDGEDSNTEDDLPF